MTSVIQGFGLLEADFGNLDAGREKNFLAVKAGPALLADPV